MECTKKSAEEVAMREENRPHLHAEIVQETRPYRLIRDEDGRCAVIEARAGHVYSLESTHPRREAVDTPQGMATVVGNGWQDDVRALALFQLMVDNEERYSQILW
jgi:hypothetical protein